MIRQYQAFAKINLFLHVTARREDGYHDLYSLMTKIDLCDDILLDFSFDKILVRCDHPQVPEDESNLAHQAARLFYRAMEADQAGIDQKKEQQGIGITITKKITPGGGLGGGSSNAATILTALNEYYKYPFSKSALMKMGLSLGADVPFFIFGSAAIARGVGEQLEAFDNLKPCYLLLCDPGVHSSTAKVYKNIDFRLTENQKYTKNTVLNEPIRGQEIDIRGSVHNDLEESACRLYPEIKNTKEEMTALLQKDVHMTGSGSSLFVLYSDRKNAEKGYEKLLTQWAGCDRNVLLSSFK
ncbi:MAG: 4-(cytidine 5'-diphospho)-2-C-methyl-D-erythritol kinase [Desulfobacula sp.]|nr:4-(cytidine 5'-diphospho)-2-C-methyl-D-erythritol kinase [Desulfobacula sp.]